jgi:hypothetical protein
LVSPPVTQLFACRISIWQASFARHKDASHGGTVNATRHFGKMDISRQANFDISNTVGRHKENLPPITIASVSRLGP